MTFRKPKFYLTVCLGLFMFNALSQNILSNYDSIPVIKRSAFKDKYELSHSNIKEITIVPGIPQPVSEHHKKLFGNIGEGLFVILTGVRTSSSYDANYTALNLLKSNDLNYDWRIPLFISGTLEKTKERVTNEDGSSSVKKEETIYIDWGKGAYGIIMQKADTLGAFTLDTNIETDTASTIWISRIESENSVEYSKIKNVYENQEKLLNKFNIKLNYNFVIKGVFKSKNFTIISSGKHWRSLILLENNPIAIFQADPNFSTLSKKKRITPYLLYNKSVDNLEIDDLLRLSLLNRLLAGQINVSQ